MQLMVGISPYMNDMDYVANVFGDKILGDSPEGTLDSHTISTFGKS